MSEDRARLFALPLGADFPAALIEGIEERWGTGPADLAHLTVIVNTARMQRRLQTLFTEGPSRLVPRVMTLSAVTQIAANAGSDPVSPLRRRLELAQLIGKAIEADPSLAPKHARFELADSLARLLDEMQGEDVAPAALDLLDVSDVSGHWQRSLSLLRLITAYVGNDSAGDPEARQRAATQAVINAWTTKPPRGPIILAGSTGSRGTTRMLMEALARVPWGYVVLPGFDFDQPQHVWDRLGVSQENEDHPQARFAALLNALDLTAKNVTLWSGTKPVSARNQLISLALRPAPVTHQWREEGPFLSDLPRASSGLTLIEADTPQHEALAIALALRAGVESGEICALITPDRNLARRVDANLARWGIVPDDSGGAPFELSPPGRLLRQSAQLMGQAASLAEILAVLKHPLVATGGEKSRGPHLLMVRAFENWARRRALPFIDHAALANWAHGDDARAIWADWLSGIVNALAEITTADLPELIDTHVKIVERLVGGPDSRDSSALWENDAGEEAQRRIAALRQDAHFGGVLAISDYLGLLHLAWSDARVRQPQAPDPRVMIWGTLEARVQGASLVVMAGLNEGIWPRQPAPDPWLNRKMRHALGLLLPERQIGLSAHDFQQAILAPQVVLSRAKRDDDSETIPARWLNRLINLLAGLHDQGGGVAVDAMRARGNKWTQIAQAMNTHQKPASAVSRPSPRPPVEARPTGLAVTQVERLIRDPYEIYARHILDLRALGPLVPQPDPRLRGTVIHMALEQWGQAQQQGSVNAPNLRDYIAPVVSAHVPWPVARLTWHSSLARHADWLQDQLEQSDATIAAVEVKGSYHLSNPSFEIRGKADRIDQDASGRLIIWDYKTGTPPSAKEIAFFDVQLLLNGIIAQGGGFASVAAAQVDAIGHLGIGSEAIEKRYSLPHSAGAITLDLAQTEKQLERLVATYADPLTGYTARRAAKTTRYQGEFDHLSRYGEWDESDIPMPEDVG